MPIPASRPHWTLVGRRDGALIGGLILAVFLVFHQPLQVVFDMAHEIERQYHIDLLQSLTVLCAVFGFHHYRKRYEAKTAMRAAEADALHARVRSEELERLVNLSRALTLASDFTQLHHALVRYLPLFAADRTYAVLIYYDGCWDVLVRDAREARSPDVLEGLAERVLMSASAGTSGAMVRDDGVVGVPLIVGVHPVGVLLVNDVPALDPNDCGALAAAAALIAITVRNVYTLLTTRDQAQRDGLTGCFNHAHAVETLDGELRRARRSGSPLSLIMFDLDGFKGVNDRHGHLAGDRLLAEVGRCVTAIVRSTDIKCRYGGDEFLLLLPDTPLVGARQLAESIRRAIADLDVHMDERRLSVTASVGLVTARDHEHDPQAILARVDEALYRAKRGGRNQVQVDNGQAEVPVTLSTAQRS